MTAITDGVSAIVDVTAQVWTLMTGNPLVMTFVGASLLGAATGVIHKLTRNKA